MRREIKEKDERKKNGVCKNCIQSADVGTDHRVWLQLHYADDYYGTQDSKGKLN